MAKRKNDKAMAAQRIQGKTVLTLPNPKPGTARRISGPGGVTTRERDHSLTEENGNHFLLDYDRIEALIAYISARLRLFSETDFVPGGALDWVADQIITGGSPIPGDPKPPRMPGPVVDEIADKLANDPA